MRYGARHWGFLMLATTTARDLVLVRIASVGEAILPVFVCLDQ